MNSSTLDPCAAAPIAADADADAREFERFAQAQDALDIEAATWAARSRNGLDAAGQAELQRWLGADTRHAAALAAMTASFGHVADQLRQLPAQAQSAWRQPLEAAAPVSSPAPARTARPARRAWLSDLFTLAPQATVAALVLMLAGGGWLGYDQWRQQPTFAQAFSTVRGQQVVATLPDDAAHGTQVQLDTGTRLEARLYRDRREVRLQSGQAMFSVHADTSRPFHVWAGPLHVVVVGTRFSVRHTASGLDAGKTVVSVEEGQVRVSRVTGEQPQAPAVALTAGQMLVGDDQGRLGPVTALPSAAVAQWRSGRISFDQTPLAQALAEFERYGNTGLVIHDPAVARLPVGGSYSPRQVRRFAETLPQVLPVRLVQHGEVTEIVSAQP